MKKLLAILTLSLIAQINAYTTTVINGTPEPQDIFFNATGCVESKDGYHFVCKLFKQVPPGASVSYSWKKGQTFRRVNPGHGSYGYYNLLKKGWDKNATLLLHTTIDSRGHSIHTLKEWKEDPIKKTIISNNTENEIIYVLFTGSGCSGSQAYNKVICKEQKLGPGQSASFDWNKQVDKEIIVKIEGYNFRSKEIKPNYSWQGFKEKKEFDSQKNSYFKVGVPKSKDFNIAIESK